MRNIVRVGIAVLAAAVSAVVVAVPGGATVPTAETAMAAPAHSRKGPAVVDYAHRGASGSAPENTIAAARFAVTQGATFVETDVRRTADGELVVMHDDKLSRTTNVEEVFPDRAPYWVHDFTLAEIRQLDAGSWFAPEFTGERVPTLREFVDALKRRSGLLLEIKGSLLYPGIEADIVAELKSIPGYLPWALATGKLVIQSFWVPAVRDIHTLLPDVPVGLLFETRPTDDVLVEASRWADQINPGNAFTDQALVDRVHELGMSINPYVVNNGRDMRRFVNLGVDGIITDYPAVMRDIVRITR
ncbi:glycerophosphodiester phosphodiesterase family protein [Micromonospora sp. NPDC047074]|uniref:glycerophosphodiester phosphodiesterase n=1 Tax=Micromonospora sp. NPDC047074 TaxID=3154339 RepID=UPI0033C03F19